MPRLETHEETDFCKWARSLMWIPYKMSNGYEDGYPDRILFASDVIGEPLIVMLEFKRPDGKGTTSAKQDDVHANLEFLGFEVYLADTAKQAKAIVAALREMEYGEHRTIMAEGRIFKLERK